MPPLPPDNRNRSPAVHDGNLRYAGYVVGALMVCYTPSFVDRQILSLLATPIKEGLGLSDHLQRLGRHEAPLIVGIAGAGICVVPR